MHFWQNLLCDFSGSESAFLDARWRCYTGRSLLRPPTFFDPPLLREISLKEYSQVVIQIFNPLNVQAFVMNWAGHTKLFVHKGKRDRAVSRPGSESGNVTISLVSIIKYPKRANFWTNSLGLAVSRGNGEKQKEPFRVSFC